jgi:ribose 5-phosphate isomerase B
VEERRKGGEKIYPRKIILEIFFMIYLGADHRGYKLKEKIKKWLEEWKFDYKDLGASKFNPQDDYPDFGFAVGEAVVRDKDTLGIVTCGSGVGVNVAVNKVKGARAGVIFNERGAVHVRKRDEVNVLVLSADYLSDERAKKIIKNFLETKVEDEERFVRRLRKIKKYDEDRR